MEPIWVLEDLLNDRPRIGLGSSPKESLEEHLFLRKNPSITSSSKKINNSKFLDGPTCKGQDA